MQDLSKHKTRRKYRFAPRFGLRGFIIFVLLVATAVGLYAERARKQKRVCEQLTANSIKWGFANPPSAFRYWPKSWGDVANSHWFCSIKWIEYQEKHSISEKLLKPKEAFELIATVPNVQWFYLGFAPSAYHRSELSEVLAPIASIRGLNTLSVNTENNDAFMAACAPMYHLRDLRLNTTLSDEGLTHLEKFPNLQEFSSNSRHLKGSGLRSIAKLASIENVELSSLACELSELQPFQGHQTLRSLTGLTCVTDQMLELFSTCPNLHAIHAGESAITDAGMAYVRRMKSLERISFSKSAVSDAGFAALADCRNLQAIDGSGCKLTDAIMDTLVQLPELKSLNLADTLTTSQQLLPKLQQFKNLSSINLGKGTIDLKQVLDFATKRQASLNPNDWGPPAWRNALKLFGAKQYPDFDLSSWNATLDLSNVRGIHGNLPSPTQTSPMNGGVSADFSNTDIDGSDLAVLSRVYNFYDIDISHTKVTARELAVLSNMRMLSTLRMGPIDDPALAFSILGNISRLNRLSIVDGGNLSEGDFKSLAAMTNVRHLIIDSPIDEQSSAILAKSASIQYISAANTTINNTAMPFRGRSVPTEISDESQLPPLGRSGIDTLVVRIPRVSDDALKAINDLDLVNLDLSNTAVNDDQLKLLTGSNLKSLKLNGNPITDKSIEQILTYKSLINLEIAATQITNHGASRILGFLPLNSFNISDTAIDVGAWQSAEAVNRVELRSLTVKNAPSAISILTKLPLENLPFSMVIDADDMQVNSEMIGMIRGELPEPTQRKWSDMPLVPATLGTWSIDQLLTVNSLGPFVTISKTGRLAEILEHLAHYPKLSYVRVVKDTFDRPLTTVPQQVRTLSLTSCKLDSQALQSIAQFRWLMNLEFNNCDFQGCSLEPLSQMPLLSRLTVKDSKLSHDQSQMLNQLKPTLIDAKGW